ncbi:MAG: alpha/beta hydrolase [Proteobacteria bacterium]|jgi:esterase/lipase superfamily enzyme|nr:alpha/beta hydrolase [Pseudomonadota bacterium]
MARRLFLLAVMLAALAECAARPEPELLAPVAPPAQLSRQVLIHVATNREPDAQHPGNFNNIHSPRLAFARYNISIPPNHKPTAVERSTSRQVDAASSFATLELTPLSGEVFTDQFAGGGNATDEADGHVLVFVHGYNTKFSESVLRMAQLLADKSFFGQAILFAWPSDDRLPGYVADKDAATTPATTWRSC